MLYDVVHVFVLFYVCINQARPLCCDNTCCLSYLYIKEWPDCCSQSQTNRTILIWNTAVIHGRSYRQTNVSSYLPASAWKWHVWLTVKAQTSHRTIAVFNTVEAHGSEAESYDLPQYAQDNCINHHDNCIHHHDNCIHHHKSYNFDSIIPKWHWNKL